MVTPERVGPWVARALLPILLLACLPASAEGAEIRLGYLHPAERLMTLSLVDRPADDLGFAGAALAIDDNNTTGRFTGQNYVLTNHGVADPAAAREAALTMVGEGAGFIIADLGADALLAVADAVADRGVIVFNAGAPDDRLRGTDCRGNIVHVAPSRAMLADALAQYLAWKRWVRWFLVVGSHPEDRAYAEAVRRAARRFGATVVEERVFTDTGGARTTDSGHVQIQAQMPVFLQGAASHDVVVVADENEVFGTYVPYHTWDPRPVVGTAGLQPTVWSPAHEQWAGIQVQNRFLAKAGRFMQAPDMLAWMGVRAAGEAATRANSVEPAAIRDYLLGPDFQLAAFKGEALSIRAWDHQLRQPILLADDTSVASVSPQEGFLHPTSFLDTLGFDAPETECRM